MRKKHKLPIPGMKSTADFTDIKKMVSNIIPMNITTQTK